MKMKKLTLDSFRKINNNFVQMWKKNFNAYIYNENLQPILGEKIFRNICANYVTNAISLI